mmetsp:Transcript_19061/g.54926  ORF Transcript_19061/g.54926 Transcript_19061/m.54926 type:complete len:559 (-) Transcript_19061:362-2038(-)|eukprot:CAMPEP_0181033206 /NCGR_PEP_ID=MMETSP1070-20121207/7132_1 /TAXON_ID=265543 /ORGANISM="Minutocellus polymorphus, Strain NH13" /LENGTH=558 /DNA_ID=CAMNT_0023110615 /DNA_START=38 /DNA_END=1714 /DNA_ORIENTATION=-
MPMNIRKPSHLLPNNSAYHHMLSPNISPHCLSLEGNATREFAKNNSDLPMMPSTPHSHQSSAHPLSALVTPRPTPSGETAELPAGIDEHAAMPSPPVMTMKRTSDDLDAAHLLASVASIASHELIMTEAVDGNDESLQMPDKGTPSPGLITSGFDRESEEEAPPSPRLTYLCTVFDRQEVCNRGSPQDLYDLRARTAPAPLRSPGHLPKFASLQRGVPIMPPPPPPPPMMMMMCSSEQDASFRTRTISVDTADSYLAPDLAYLRNSYESGRVHGVPSTFVSVPTIISPPSSPSSGPRPTGPRAISSVSSPRKHKTSRESLDDDFFEEDGDNGDYVDAGADNDDDDDEYLPAAKRSRKKHKSSRSTKATSVATSGSSRASAARAARKGVYVSASKLLKDHKGNIQSAQSLKPQCDGGGGNPKFRIVLREKFSWKLYPELEAFLVANRDEYLCHSALNYTVQQKTYNNELTQRLIDLASCNGYVFDEQTFSFVCVRDRIRCYFKSFVQSRKKQGIIIGFAAKRAGLINAKELKKIASSKNTIIVPPPSPKASSKRQKVKK